ncbi:MULTISPECIES: UvrD-helicase domain-containing protein [unclassified Synechocystis]|uniref:UvrD-helicase domain-containing protein n=1 Tax=unclassified Synechocystis TaxID=2640012 RepID=UPI00040BEA99|nr:MULTISPECIES: UvrD-helicase domain-containing protein [unclassified Synechocystis]AIE75754.1 ATP-dependent nuclease subunit A [Synechocystis sp. PCC 6714]MCT0255307.1 UvrD-helicase domain-containing protein [Synechocystis sp. CS-94]
MALTPQQKQAATSSKSVAITAGAGTGKTYMLAGRYLFHLQTQDLSPLQIVAMTFTDKAAIELRSRIRQTVQQQATDRFDWLAELEAAPICTFHSLAARICREHPEAAGVPADFTPLDEWEGQLWQAEQMAIALDQLPNELYAQIPYSLMKAAMEVFLQDPLSTEEALQRTREDWWPILQKAQENVIETLLNDPFWQESQAIISQNQGKAGDKLEAVRQSALTLIETIEKYQHDVQSEEFQSVFQAWSKFKIGNIGSKKNWADEETLKNVRRTLIDWRDFTKDFPNTELVTVQWGQFDKQIEAILPDLREAFIFVRDVISRAKVHQRLLDFNDLEICALRALADTQVRDYYQHRWQAFLIDEFQDTNSIQGILLEALTEGKTLTLVGDEKQSIYGFRRADIQVFQQWRDRLSNTIPLSTSFRTHAPLIENINQIFAPILADLHQDLDGDRLEPPHPAPHVESFIIIPDPDSATKPTVEQLRQYEAQHIAHLVQQMLQEKRLVWDKKTREHRPIEPRDIAILARTWEPLELYGQAIGNLQIPVLQAGGGNLLDTREAKDGIALLRFLADARDDIALVAVLRSPFFAWSDRQLLELRQAAPDNQKWWQLLQESNDQITIQTVEILKKLRHHRHIDPPSRLLQLADRLTGYTAVIANLPKSERHLADWQGFLDTVRRLEAGSNETFIVARRLKRLVEKKVEIKRLPLEAGNAITLMTIHGAKGLEWPVVIVPDLSRKSQSDHAQVCFDPQLGVAFKQEDESGEQQKSALYLLLAQRQQTQDLEEMKRLLYVAATRAGDRLIFTTGQGDRGLNLWQLLQVGLQGEFSPQEIVYQPENLSHFNSSDPPLPELPSEILIKPVFGGLQLPVTALTDYARCPKQFDYKYIKGHPGETITTGQFGREIGILTHSILAQNIKDITKISAPDLNLPTDKIKEAFTLAEQFRNHPNFSAVQSGQWERFLSLKLGKIRFNGLADLIGQNFVLDIKTEQEVNPQEHRFQLWAYAKATQKSQAYIAYLRHNQLCYFSTDDLQVISEEADQLLTAIANKEFEPTPSVKACEYCPYTDICEHADSSVQNQDTNKI